jgi:hypothetical protein
VERALPTQEMTTDIGTDAVEVETVPGLVSARAGAVTARIAANAEKAAILLIIVLVTNAIFRPLFNFEILY